MKLNNPIIKPNLNNSNCPKNTQPLKKTGAVLIEFFLCDLSYKNLKTIRFILKYNEFP